MPTKQGFALEHEKSAEHMLLELVTGKRFRASEVTGGDVASGMPEPSKQIAH